MPIPVLPLAIGAAGAAILFAGSKEKAANDSAMSNGTRSGETATPTTQTAGGAQGGAQAPSHADFVNTAPDAPLVDGPPGSLTANESTVAQPVTDAVQTSTGIIVGDPEHVTDVWAPSSGPSLDTNQLGTQPGGALAGIFTVAGLSGQAAADSFVATGDAFGWIW